MSILYTHGQIDHESLDDVHAKIDIDIKFFYAKDMIINKKHFHGKRFLHFYETEYFLLYQKVGVSLTHRFRLHF